MTASASARTSHPMVAWLDETDVERDRIGGKAASLNRLAALGFRIPPGFCLTTDAFAIQAASLPGSEILRSDPTALHGEETRSALVEAMIAGPMSPEVAAALAGPLERLAGLGLGEADGPPLLAVRSSGVAEDGSAASFAGLHDTELGLTADEVVPAVLRCWASLWSDRAVGYRARRGLALDGDAMAVVVQALVPARAAAVVFTRHPVSGRTDQLLINAAPGLGEAMVSGTITPDTIVVDKATRAVVEFTPGDSGGGPALADGVRDELVGLCLDVERAFDAPVDIEAAHADDGWYLLQARPITTA
jgi:phosphoenolpyruvate synthase/pyruvate phosphate dikinase